MTVRVTGPKDYLPGQVPPNIIDTTSRSKTWSRGLSPFLCGPVPLYEGAPIPEAKKVEGAWQFSKVYAPHVGPLGDPTPEYFLWATKGWQSDRAERYPMGKGAKPEFSWWGRRLDYFEARKVIYIPIYAKAVVKTEAFAQLLALYQERGAVTLWDFDGYDHLRMGRTLKCVINDPNRKMGHAFVLAAILERMV